MRRIYIVGRLPAVGEVGGVTTFMYNFMKKYREALSPVAIDLYPAEGKMVPAECEAVLIRGGVLRRFFSLWTFLVGRRGVFFFNFSTTRALVLLSLLPKLRRARWIVVLHNGEQDAAYNSLPWYVRFVIRMTVRRVDVFGAISGAQEKFYERIGARRVVRVSPYIQRDSNEWDVRRTKRNLRIGALTFLVSGFPTAIYRHEEVLRVFEKLRSEGYDFRVILSLYGYDSEGRQSSLTKMAHTMPFVTLRSHLSMEEFSRLLNTVDCYVRMNAVDSFGLVVAEAIEQGVDVIATDVCERYPGAHLLPVDDFRGLLLVLRKYCEGRNLGELIPTQKAVVQPSDLGGLLSSLR